MNISFSILRDVFIIDRPLRTKLDTTDTMTAMMLKNRPIFHHLDIF